MLTRKLLPVALALVALVGLSGSALAHEHVKTPDGKYELTVGWRTEPAYAGLKNGLDLKVERILAEGEGDGHDHDHASHDHGAGDKQIVEGLVNNLTVTYEIAGKTFTPPDFRAQHGRPGWYTAEITPTREGEYTVRIVGNIGDDKIDLRVKPHAVESYSSTMFPEPDYTPEEVGIEISDLQQQVRDLQVEVDALKAKTAAQGETTEQEAPNGTPAPAAALVGLAAVGVALAMRKRK